MLISFWWQYLVLFVVSYLVGNFCAAFVLSKKIFRKDIRDLGSKNPGTTNMSRVYGIKYGIATFLIDCFKAMICVAAAKIIFTGSGGEDAGTLGSLIAGLSVILGHNYPVVLGFKGGKGFASAIGVFLVVNPVFTAIILSVGIIVLFIVDRMSVCALAFFALQVIYYLFTVSEQYWWITTFAAIYLLLAIIAHWPNVVRLFHGEEKTLGLRKKLKLKRG